MSDEFLRIKVTSDPITGAQTLFADCAALNGAAPREEKETIESCEKDQLAAAACNPCAALLSRCSIWLMHSIGGILS
jgi:hypothetical protein